MPRFYVCSLARLVDTIEKTGARSLVALLSPGTPVERPSVIRPEQYLHLAFSDIVAPARGLTLAERGHLVRLMAFVLGRGRADPMLIHCYAGVSRSPAAAFIVACALKPERDEREIARALRAASPTATPNARLVALADEMLDRSGRMTAAIAEIGRGEECFEGKPFALDLG